MDLLQPRESVPLWGEARSKTPGEEVEEPSHRHRVFSPLVAARHAKRTRVGHRDLIDLIGVKPDLPLAALKDGGCEALLKTK